MATRSGSARRRSSSEKSDVNRGLHISGLHILGIVAALAVGAPAGGQSLREVDRVYLDDILPGRNQEDTVELYLRAVTRYGEPVRDLRSADITVNDAGERIDPETIEVSTLAETGAGMTCVLAIDTSRTMRGEPFERARNAALEFVKLLDPKDKVAIIGFSDDVDVRVGFSASRAEATAQLELLEIDPTSLSTVLNDGLHKAIELIRLGENLPRRAFVIVFSDGKDAGSHRSMGQVTEFAQGNLTQAPILVFSIGYARFGGDGLPVLEKLSKETGGEFLRAESPIHMTSFFNSTQRQMKDSLVIRYPGEMDGEEHGVEVTIEGKTASRTVRYPDRPKPILPWIIAGLALVIVVLLGVLVARGRSGGRLVFVSGPLSGQAIALTGPKTTIGALADNDIVLGLDTISRYHAAIHSSGRRVEIQDLDSANGTFVNETQISSGPLRRGDRIRFADVEATYER